MTTKSKKKNNKSSLSRDYVEKFVNNVESKLSNFNTQFLTPYKEKLDKLDSSVIKDIEKNLNAPTAIIKSALDELWNYHWILGQKDVLQNEGKKRANFNNNIELITFAEEDIVLGAITNARVQRQQLKTISVEVAKQEKRLSVQLIKPSIKQNSAEIENINTTLDSLNNQLNQFLGFVLGNSQKTQRYKAIEIRVRDLQETVRNMELKIASKSNIPKPRDIDILNSSEFGTIYQDKRTLVLGAKYSQDHKELIINNIKKYFLKVAGGRPINRETTLFRDLTENTLSNISRVKRIAETEISVAYNLGRLKKLEELGYTKVRITNEAENRSNRTIAINTYGSIPKAYRSGNRQSFMPILCTYCKEKNGEEMLISDLYQSNSSTRYGEVESSGKYYSASPPFHVSCWCYFVGVEKEDEDREPSLLTEAAELFKNNVIANSLAGQTTTDKSFYNDPFIKKLVIGGIGLLSVGVAYTAFNKLSRNRIPVRIPVRIPNKKVNLNPTVINDVSEEAQQRLLKGFINSLDNTVMEEMLDFADELPNSVNIPNVKNNVITAIDTQLSKEKFPVGKLLDITINELILDNTDYIGVLGSLLQSKRSYQTIRDRIIEGQLSGLDLDELYQSYLDAKSSYESQLKEYLKTTRNKKSIISDVNANLNISARETLLSNRESIPQNISLEDALENLKSRQVLDTSNKQLKNIERNLNSEIKNINNLQSKESRLVDRQLQGKDTRARAEQLKNIPVTLSTITNSTKTLDSVVNNVNKLKRELNDNRLDINNIRNISKQRLDSSSLVDRAALIDTQKSYSRQVMTEKERVLGQLQKFDKVDNLENFSNLYRSEISNKVKTGYQYSQGIWTKSDISKLDSTYKDISNVLTIKKSYESYLSELDDMLEKMSNFERTITGDIQFSISYEQNENIILLNKIRIISKIKK